VKFLLTAHRESEISRVARETDSSKGRNRMSLIKSIMQRDLVLASEFESIKTAVESLASRNVGALLVTRNGKLIGIVSERDVLRRVMATDKKATDTCVLDIATRNPTTVDEDTPIRECIRIIRKRGFRHLPIVDAQQHPIGIVSSRDLLQFVADAFEKQLESLRSELHREEMTDPYDSLCC
jgi:CBS domain-containing protein